MSVATITTFPVSSLNSNNSTNSNNNDTPKNDHNNNINNDHKNIRIYIKYKGTLLCHLLKFKCKHRCCGSIYKYMWKMHHYC